MFARELLAVIGPGAALGVLGSMNATATAAGTSQATGTAITTVFTYCTTATDGQGFTLPASMQASDQATVCNATTVGVCVYPPSGGKLNGATAGIPVRLAPNSTAEFTCVDGTNWIANW